MQDRNRIEWYATACKLDSSKVEEAHVQDCIEAFLRLRVDRDIASRSPCFAADRRKYASVRV